MSQMKKKLKVGELPKLRTEKKPQNNKTHECMVFDWVLNQKKKKKCYKKNCGDYQKNLNLKYEMQLKLKIVNNW